MYIVTGATGFIGSNLLAEMQARGYRDIVAVDTFGNGDKWRNVAKRGAVDFVLPNQLDDFLKNNADDILTVFHLGAISSTTETDVDKIVENNYQLTIKLYRFCQEENIQLIYASSAATYGGGEFGFEDRDDIDFLSQLRPLNPYGWSKNSVDKYISETEGFDYRPVVGLKFFNVYGPNEYHKGMQMSVVRHFYEQYKKNGKVRLFKSYRDDCLDGEQKRDFVWVGDCVDVMIWMMENHLASGLFNVGTGSATSYNTIAECVARSMGIEPVIEFIDMPDSVKNQYQYFTEANLDKLREAGYTKEMTGVPEGVEEYVRGYLMNEDIYR
ncbi:MAG: ADP-glyceromanno-heptose 6-epimerase [Bacteroidales bacterium]|nr:ADP-glyceromanno-heptose 6-epimerase [Bacteroidales bacterium]